MPVKGQRSHDPVIEIYPEGDYVLTVHRWTTAKEEQFVRGDLVHLDEGEATRLGNSNAVAAIGTMEARRAQTSSIADEGERKVKMMLLDAEALEQRAKRLREDAGAGGE